MGPRWCWCAPTGPAVPSTPTSVRAWPARRWCGTIGQWLHEQGALPLVLESQATEWVRPVHEALVAEAGRLGVEPRQLACTLLFAVLSADGAAFGQIGDGAIVARRGEAYEHLLWPARANTPIPRSS